ncbi:hypothetical protein F9K50_09720, partial [bacterium]
MTGLAFIGLFPAQLLAGGAHQTTVEGIPYRWEKSVVYNLDRGDLKPGMAAYSHDAAAQMVAESFAAWRGALSQGDISIGAGTDLPLTADGAGDDVHGGNYALYLNSSKNVNPIVFD